MRTIEYEGNEYKVPEEARYIARDVDWSVWWYENEPRYHNGCWSTHIGGFGQLDFSYSDSPYTLERI